MKNQAKLFLAPFVLFFLILSTQSLLAQRTPPRFYSEECEEIEDPQERQICAGQAMLELLYKNVEYPPQAKAEGIEGTVVISIKIDEAGIVYETTISHDIGMGCGDAAQAVVEDYLYAWVPATEDGEPIPFNGMRIPVKFALHY